MRNGHLIKSISEPTHIAVCCPRDLFAATRAPSESNAMCFFKVRYPVRINTQISVKDMFRPSIYAVMLS